MTYFSGLFWTATSISGKEKSLVSGEPWNQLRSDPFWEQLGPVHAQGSLGLVTEVGGGDLCGHEGPERPDRGRKNHQDMRDTGLPIPPIPVCPERPHSSSGGAQALIASRIRSEKMQASGTCHADRRLGVWGRVEGLVCAHVCSAQE
ncbi:hypothetical protein J1605_012349 [Eschrichtius robustus]|uniref:Uncharacterized protein n=1 Tax=Eschrichtius robustus TaxID=9764 RepID=A0AB34GL30_ESCRO|nr:hypothetical protein J1605_012349 [Eschrichtius robustus]